MKEKVSFFRSLKVTKHSLFIVVHARHIKYITTATDYKLTGPGPISPDDVRNFVRTYGDSFVSSITTGGEYYGIYTFNSRSSEERTKLDASLQANGIYSGISADASLQVKMRSFLKDVNISWDLDQHVSGIQNPKLPQADTLPSYAQEFLQMELDGPTVISLLTNGYEKAPGFRMSPSFETVKRNRAYFNSLSIKQDDLTLLQNDLDEIDEVYKIYNFTGDQQLASAKQSVRKDLADVNTQLQAYEDNCLQDFSEPPLRSLNLGKPEIDFATFESSQAGRRSSVAFDTVPNVASSVHVGERLDSVDVIAGGLVDNLYVRYVDKKGRTRVASQGGSGGSHHGPVHLDPGVTISRVEGRSGDVIDYLRFIFSNGRIMDGGDSDPRNPEFAFVPPSGSFLIGFRGATFEDGDGNKIGQIRSVYVALRAATWVVAD